ncbi:MAG: SUMF1/EgtB/PvdO family nonheme iron enzyme [Bacteroidetes bacterium]|nr:SUMF1/EgtB/PvdO family nonheme iron enzyme [Bacteroidota bacterium]
MKQILKTIAVAAVLLTLNFKLGTLNCSANNLQIGAPTLPSTTTIQFTIQWDNSWKVLNGGVSTWDAVWVFVKYQDCSTQLWTHVNVTGSSVTGGVLQIDNAGDGLNKGVFIRRTADAAGNIASATVTLNMTSVTDAGYNYQVFGIEMVRVPTGSFYVGDGAATWKLGTYNAPTTPYQVTTNGLMNLAIDNASIPNVVPAAYPEGYDAFYCMKYEISQEQYVGFLNSLTHDQQVNHTAVAPTSPANTYAMTVGAAIQNRNGIRIITPGIFNTTPAVYGCDFTSGTFNQADDGQNIACNWMNWNDLIAYLDWAALRPMSEMEYEKACRGTVIPVALGYPWDNVTINSATSAALTGGTSGLATETSTSTADGLCAYLGAAASGPLRVGFAATAISGRTGAGATYYGVMDMGGNVAEQTVMLSTIAASNTFTTAAGDGVLTAAGYCNTANTPTFTLSGTRGGAWNDAVTTYVQMSMRNSTTIEFRNKAAGGRGVRMP